MALSQYYFSLISLGYLKFGMSASRIAHQLHMLFARGFDVLQQILNIIATGTRTVHGYISVMVIRKEE